MCYTTVDAFRFGLFRKQTPRVCAWKDKNTLQAFSPAKAIQGLKPLEDGCLLVLSFWDTNTAKNLFAEIERSIVLAEKLKIIPLGGLDEIGKNITVLEYGKDMIVVDCGVGFPEEDMYGVDLVIPDFSYLVANQKKLRGFFITHGHEDHIGSIPYAMREVNCPIHGTAMTNGLIKLKLEEHTLADKVKLITHKPGDVVKAGCF